jgi:hypothetical protein
LHTTGNLRIHRQPRVNENEYDEKNSDERKKYELKFARMVERGLYDSRENRTIGDEEMKQ